MRARRALCRLPLAMFAVFTLIFATTNAVFAHVTVKPGEVETATYQVFTVSVPNEKAIPTVSVKLLVPDALATITPTKKAGWEVALEREGDGDDVRVTSVTWSGGEITDGLRDEFSFSARTPDSPTELQWKAYQTYSDGTVVAWDQEAEGGGHESDSGPFSVTSVVEDIAGDKSTDGVNNAASDDQASADRALYVAIAGVGVGLVALFLATRKK